jgi:hypothetical protein
VKLFPSKLKLIPRRHRSLKAALFKNSNDGKLVSMRAPALNAPRCWPTTISLPFQFRKEACRNEVKP